jgi:transposase-like protein
MALKVLKASGSKSADFDPKAEAVRLYRDGKPAADIANALRVKPVTLYKWLRDAGLAWRQKDRFKDLAETWKAEYLAGSSPKAIADKHGVNAKSITNALVRQGVVLRGPSEAHGVRPTWVGEWKSAHENGESLTDIGRRYGVSARTVAANLRKKGVRAPTPTEQAGITGALVETWVRRYAEGVPASTLAAEAGVNASSVQRRLKRRGVRLRPRAAYAQIAESEIAEWTRLFAAGEPINRIAKRFGRDFYTVSSRVRPQETHANE